MANPINTRNFNNIYNALTADKLRNFLSQIDPTDFATLDKDFKNLLNARARTMSGSMTDPQTLMQLAQYGGRQGALPGAGLGAALGFVTAPGTESENIVGAKSYKAPTIGDRLMNALTYGAGGAAIGAGAGAFNMRQLAKQLSGRNAPPEVMEAFLNQAKLGPEVEKLVANAHSVATRGGKNLNPTAIFRDESELAGLIARLQASLVADDSSRGLLRRWWSGDDYNTHIKRQILSGLLGKSVDELADPAISKEFASAAQRLYPTLNNNTAKTLRDVSEGAMAGRFAAPEGAHVKNTLSGSDAVTGAPVGGAIGAILGNLVAPGVGTGAGAILGAGAGAGIGARARSFIDKLTGKSPNLKDQSILSAIGSGNKDDFQKMYGNLEMNLKPGFGKKDADILRNEFFKLNDLYTKNILKPQFGPGLDPTRAALKAQIGRRALRAAGLGTLGVAGAGAAYGIGGGFSGAVGSAADPSADPNAQQLKPTPAEPKKTQPRPKPTQAPIPAAPVMTPMAPVMSPPMHTFPNMDFIDPDIINNMGNMHKAGAARVRPSSAIVSAITGLARTK